MVYETEITINDLSVLIEFDSETETFSYITKRKVKNESKSKKESESESGNNAGSKTGSKPGNDNRTEADQFLAE